MPKSFVPLSILTFLLMLPFSAFAQQADFMRSIGKIYVVVAVLVAVFVGIVVFLVFLERKLTKLENQIQKYGDE